MQRFFPSLAVVFLGFLALPAGLNGEDAAYYARRAMECSQKGEYDKAILHCNGALRLLKPRDAERFVVFLIRGSAWNMKGEYDKAIADYTWALAINPRDAGAYSGRGWVRYRKGQYDKALADYNQALRLNPRDASFQSNLAAFYATCPDEKYRDGKKAVEHATEACRLSEEKDWHCQETLAAAYAASGDFEKAAQREAKAVALAPDEKSKQACGLRLELYKQANRPREEPDSAEGAERAFAGPPPGWPKFLEGLAGRMQVRIKNPNAFRVRVGLLCDGRGLNFVVPANGTRSVFVPNGRYEIYFQYSKDPSSVYQGDGFTLNNSGVEIQIVQVVDGNYGIRKVN